MPETIGSGVALVDYDKDGWLDIYFVNSLSDAARAGMAPENSAALFRNNQDGTFEDVTRQAGVANRRWGSGVCAGDVNNDGWVDLFVSNFGKSRLYLNQGNGEFTDVAEQARVQVDAWATGCAFGDYDRDGLLDLYVASYVNFDWESPPPPGGSATAPRPVSPDTARQAGNAPATGVAFESGLPACVYYGTPVACGPKGLEPAADHLYRNEGAGEFRDVTKSAGLRGGRASYGLAVAWVDADDDGWLDLIVANDSMPNFLYRNLGDGTFEELGVLSGLGTNGDGLEQAYMGVAVGDYNHDGRNDLFFTTFAGDNYTLHRNGGNLDFTDVTLQSGLLAVTLPYLGWGAEFLDYDNDGRLDILAANGHIFPQADPATWGTSYKQRTLLLRNLGNGRFADAADEAGSGFARAKSSRGAAVGDLFNRGTLDVVLNNLDSMPTLLRNRRTMGGHHWVGLQLVGDPGRQTPRDAIGSVAYVDAGGFRQRAEVSSGRGYLSQSDQRVHFGLRTADTVDSLEVIWSNGQRENYAIPAVDRLFVIEQGKGLRE